LFGEFCGEGGKYMTLELNNLEKKILQYLAKSKEGYYHRHNMSDRLHFHKTYSVNYYFLEEYFLDKRKVPSKEFFNAIDFLRLQGYIFWDNGDWCLTEKGKLFCGIRDRLNPNQKGNSEI